MVGSQKPGATSPWSGRRGQHAGADAQQKASPVAGERRHAQGQVGDVEGSGGAVDQRRPIRNSSDATRLIAMYCMPAWMRRRL